MYPWLSRNCPSRGHPSPRLRTRSHHSGDRKHHRPTPHACRMKGIRTASLVRHAKRDGSTPAFPPKSPRRPMTSNRADSSQIFCARNVRLHDQSVRIASTKLRSSSASAISLPITAPSPFFVLDCARIARPRPPRSTTVRAPTTTGWHRTSPLAPRAPLTASPVPRPCKSPFAPTRLGGNSLRKAPSACVGRRLSGDHQDRNAVHPPESPAHREISSSCARLPCRWLRLSGNDGARLR